MTTRKPLIERLLVHIEITPSCWLWRGSVADNGYGHIRGWVDGKWKNRLVHRVAYELFVGPLPADMQPDHLCKVKNCINPDHLEAVTPRENVMRTGGPPALNARKSHCLRGHEFTEANTSLCLGKRICKTCKRGWRKRAAAVAALSGS